MASIISLGNALKSTTVLIINCMFFKPAAVPIGVLTILPLLVLVDSVFNVVCLA
jgi:hypothetical protein